MMQVKGVRVVGHIVFGGELAPDPDGAVIALQKAGYTVARMPERFRPHVYHPEDYFMLAVIGGTISDEDKVAGAVMDEINRIVDRYGGLCHECGAEPPDYVPSFDELFEPRRWHSH
jgi:hypothetical protein